MLLRVLDLSTMSLTLVHTDEILGGSLVGEGGVKGSDLVVDQSHSDDCTWFPEI